MVIPSKINYSPTSKSSLSTKIVVYKEFVGATIRNKLFTNLPNTGSPMEKKGDTVLFFVNIHMFIPFFFSHANIILVRDLYEGELFIMLDGP